MTKVVAIVSSPRKDGNTSAIVDAITIGTMGITTTTEVELFHLNDLTVKSGCEACMRCKIYKRCIKVDDLTKILNSINECDAAIISTPVYFGEKNSQYKMLEDRMFSLLDSDYKTNYLTKKKRRLVTVVSCGTDIEEANSVASNIEKFYSEKFGFEIFGRITYNDDNSRNLAFNNPELLNDAKLLGERLERICYYDIESYNKV